MKARILMGMALTWATASYSQPADSTTQADDIAVLARVSGDSVTLRWAPISFKIWQAGNVNGYVVERYTMTRDNKVIPPEKKLLTKMPVLREPLDGWKTLVANDRYAAIAAQALFGSEFSVSIEKADAVSIANKIQENDQRFSFALLSADMSPEVAQKSALWISDKINSNERYLYRVLIADGDQVYRGSVFVNPLDSVVLVPPKSLEADVDGHRVNLKWRVEQRTKYSWFRVERSIDSITFESIAEIPTVTLSPTPTENLGFSYAMDSIPDLTRKYFYRVIGITPFSDVSTPSNVVDVVADIRPQVIPRITAVESIDNKTTTIRWEFPSDQTHLINGFQIERGSNEYELRPLSLSHISATDRAFVDQQPLPINYYRVSAIMTSGQKLSSFSQLAVLVDSIPPSPPEGLKAAVDEHGRVELTWRQNNESDLYGYRVYKSNNSREEAFQLTSAPIPGNGLTDQVNLRTLNKFVFYHAVAIDRNQNQSQLSAQLKVRLPDQLPPMPPTMLPVTMDSMELMIRWQGSGSADVKQYDVYRSAINDNHWIRIEVVPHTVDSIFAIRGGSETLIKEYQYSVVAVDSFNNESPRALSVRGKMIAVTLADQVLWNPSEVSPEHKTVRLRWEYKAKGVIHFKLFKAIDTETLSLYKTIPANQRVFDDIISEGQSYRYQIIATFDNGRKSKFSESLQIKF